MIKFSDCIPPFRAADAAGGERSEENKPQQAIKSMQVPFLNPEPAFDGTEGWLTITKLDSIDPISARGTKRRFKVVEEAVMLDGTIFVFATPTQQGQ